MLADADHHGRAIARGALTESELDRIAKKYAGVIDVVKMDVDANPGVSQALQIMNLPTVAFFRPGQQPMAVVGARSAEQFETSFGLSQYATAKT